ncbi:MAG: hypothetical protein ACNA78_11045 [Balneolaceae bacterium]
MNVLPLFVSGKFFTLSLVLLITAACSTTNQTTAPSSLNTKIVENPEMYRDITVASLTGERGLLGMLTGNAVSLARDAVVGIVDKERSRTTLSHTDARSDLYFYDQLSDLHPLDPTGIRFEGLDIVRYQAGDPAARDTALTVSLKLDHSNPNELLNNSIFRLYVDDLRVFDSEVAMGREWYKPWSWFRSDKKELNLSMIITFYGNWIDDNMVMHSEVPMGRFVLSLRNVPLKGHPDYNDGHVNPARAQVRGFSYLIPRSTGFTYNDDVELIKKYGQGRFSINVEITESRTADPRTTTMVQMTGDLFDGVVGMP